MNENEITYYYGEEEDWSNVTSTNTNSAEDVINNNNQNEAFFADVDVGDVSMNTNTVTSDNLVLKDMTINVEEKTQWGIPINDGSGFTKEALGVSDRLGEQNVRKDFSINLETFGGRENGFRLAQPTKIITLQEIGLPEPTLIKPNPYIPLIFGGLTLLFFLYLTITKSLLKRRVIKYESYLTRQDVIDDFQLQDFNFIDDDLFDNKGVEIK